MIVAFVLNLFVFVSVFGSVLYAYIHWDPETGGSKAFLFRFFTTDSNIFCAISSLLFCIACVCTGFEGCPAWLMSIRFVATGSVVLTFLTVMFFLGPTKGYKEMLTGPNLFLHCVSPLASLASLVFFESINASILEALLGILPCFVYGTIYFICVIVKEKWPDFYGFNMGGRWYLTYPVMMIAMAGISFGMRALTILF